MQKRSITDNATGCPCLTALIFEPPENVNTCFTDAVTTEYFPPENTKKFNKICHFHQQVVIRASSH
jgi:hypothetical protein